MVVKGSRPYFLQHFFACAAAVTASPRVATVDRPSRSNLYYKYYWYYKQYQVYTCCVFLLDGMY